MAIPQIVVEADNLSRLSLPRAAATQVDVGDPISYESNLVTVMNAAGDDATFAGVSNTRHDANDNTPLEILSFLRCIVDFDTVSVAYSMSAGLKWSADNDPKLDADGGADTIAWIAKDYSGAAVTRARVLVDVLMLAKLFGVDA